MVPGRVIQYQDTWSYKSVCKILGKSFLQYLKIRKIMSKVTFWSQCETFLESEWLTANHAVYKFCFSKNNKSNPFLSIEMSKTVFPKSKGRFDICLPSKRIEAVIVFLFFHSIQNSPIYIIILELVADYNSNH
eukprot:TRINITY_DN1118_c0_g1_i8.p1 TRINITY_DN1118_c0_g1~~TRINITY_DN1118_c0_g1_i8.p1  ORF type:complete len:133 (+),score=11.04 TRINITY_DN1118_c0_g1_i8:1144-1542(+)